MGSTVREADDSVDLVGRKDVCEARSVSRRSQRSHPRKLTRSDLVVAGRRLGGLERVPLIEKALRIGTLHDERSAKRVSTSPQSTIKEELTL